MAYGLPSARPEDIENCRIVDEGSDSFCGVPKAVLTDRGTNLLSHLMLDICSKLGITKMNTTAYHPECNGMVKRFNRTLKSMLHKHADKFGMQWDQYLLYLICCGHTETRPMRVLVRNRHFCYLVLTAGHLLRVHCYHLIHLILLKCQTIVRSSCCRYHQPEPWLLPRFRELNRSTRSAMIRKANSAHSRLVSGYFPHEETGRMRKLLRPWHGPFRVVSREDPDITVSNVYFPNDTQIKVHQSRVSHCPKEFPAGYYWYGGKRKGTGAPPAWVDKLLNSPGQSDFNSSSETAETEMTEASEPEGQDNDSPNDNVINTESDEEENTEPGMVCEQQADVQPEVNVTPRSKRSRYSLRDLTKRPRRFT